MGRGRVAAAAGAVVVLLLLGAARTGAVPEDVAAARPAAGALAAEEAAAPPTAVAPAPVPVRPPAPPAPPAAAPTAAPTAPPAPAPRPAAPRAPAVPAAPALGGDVSWPNCPVGLGIPERPTLGLPQPLPEARFVVLGLTNGPAFTPDPCLADLVAQQRSAGRWLGAYAVTTFPTDAELATYGGSGDRRGRLRRVGQAQAAYDVEQLRGAGLAAPMVWVDVEPSKGRPWSADPAENLAVVQGVLDGLRGAGLRVGLYTYRSGWQQITGGAAFPDLPAWVPGGGGRAGALGRCAAASAPGGPVWLAQWVEGDRDLDVTCPGLSEASFRSAFTR